MSPVILVLIQECMKATCMYSFIDPGFTDIGQIAVSRGDSWSGGQGANPDRETICRGGKLTPYDTRD